MMCAVWVILLSWCAAPYLDRVTPQVPVTADSSQDWESLIARLREVEGVEASLVGFVYTPSEWYALYEAVIAQGDREKFLGLAQDEHPVVCCVGLLALARTEGRVAVPVLRRHLCDRQWLGYQVYDMGDAMTVGRFALRLLYDPNCLVVDDRRGRSSLLSEMEWRGLYLEVLADDAAVSVHGSVATSLSRAVGRHKLTLELPMLRQMAPSLTDWQIIKAIGRIRLSDASRTFLIGCVEMDELSPEARLAAASALTRHTDVECARALRVNRETLNQIDGEPWGDFFVEILNARRTHEKNIQPIRAARSWWDRQRRRDRFLSANTCDHPLALDDLLGASGMRRHVHVNAVTARSLIAISNNLDRFNQPWSTYADTAFKLDLFLRYVRWQEREDEKLRAEVLNHRRSWSLFEGTASEPNMSSRGLVELGWQSDKLRIEIPEVSHDDALLTEEQCAQIERNLREFTGPSAP